MNALIGLSCVAAMAGLLFSGPVMGAFAGLIACAVASSAFVMSSLPRR